MCDGGHGGGIPIIADWKSRGPDVFFLYYICIFFMNFPFLEFFPVVLTPADL